MTALKPETTTPPTPIQDGGPAFAAQGSDRYSFQKGMSLREYYAGQATEADLQDILYKSFGCGALPTRIQARFLFADAMIAALR